MPPKEASKVLETSDQDPSAKFTIDISKLNEAQLAVVRRELRIDELENKITLNKRELKSMTKEYGELIAQRKAPLGSDC